MDIISTGKTWTMGSASSSEMRLGGDNFGIIPRVIESLFEIMEQKELDDPNSTYKVQVQFLEIYGENIRDLLDPTRTSKVSIRETAAGEVFVSGAREEFVSSASQMMKTLEDGTKHRTTASTLMNLTSSRSHGKKCFDVGTEPFQPFSSYISSPIDLILSSLHFFFVFTLFFLLFFLSSHFYCFLRTNNSYICRN